MATAFVAQHTSDANKTASNQFTPVTASAVASGNKLIAILAFDNDGTNSPTVTSGPDAHWSRSGQAFTLQTAAAGGVNIEVWESDGTAYASGVGLTFSLTASVTARAAGLIEVSGVGAVRAIRTAGLTGSALVGSPTGTVAGDMMVAACATESNAAPTMSGTGYNNLTGTSTTGGGAATNVGVGFGYNNTTTNGVNITVSDGSYVFVSWQPAATSTPVSASDSGTFSASSETSSLAITNVVTASDSGTFSATETANLNRTTPDSGTFSATETSALAATSSSTDSGTFSDTETSAVAVVLNRTDAGTFSATETSSLLISNTISAVDSGTFSATETSSSSSTLSRTDSGTFSATETSALSLSPATSDSGTFSATESSSVQVVLSTSDSGTFSATETSAVPYPWSIVTENAIATDIYDKTYYLQYASEAIPTFVRSTYYTRGQTAQFSTNYGTAYQIKIYRLGYYGGPGGHLVATITGTPTSQPAGVVIPNSNGALTYAGWSVTDQWAIPANATPGWYWATFVDSVNNNAAGVPFVVSDADQKAPVVVVSSEATWHGAYNGMGGNNLYGASFGVGSITDRALCVSYDKPVITRDYVPQTHFVNGELAMLRFIERMGFEVGYTTIEQIDADPTILNGRTHIIFSGHNEYISQRVRDKVVDRIANGVRIFNFAGNDFFWRTAYGDENGFTHGSHLGRVMWCKKDTMGGPGAHVAGQPFTTQADWMGTWQDTRWTNAAGTTELLGDRFIANGIRSDEVKVPFDYRTYPIWRNCSGIQSLTTGGTFSFGGGTAGMEWDMPQSSTLQFVKLSKSTVNLDGSVSDINGQFYNGNGTYDHAFQLSKSGSSYIFNANTTQWAWALDDMHDRGSAISTTEGRQSTLNIFYDLGMTGSSSMISTAGLTVPTPVSSIDVSYGLSGDVNPTASETGTISATESASLLVTIGGGGGGGTSTQHSIFGTTVPPVATMYTDGGAHITLGDAFYRTTTATNGWRVIGAKVYVPAGASETSLTISLYTTTYQTTAFNITSPGTPLQTKTITPVANQWNSVYFDTPYDLPVSTATNGVAWLTYTFGNGHYVAAGGGTTTTVQASDGSNIWVAENLVGPGSLGQAPQFTIDGGAASANSTANYGIDIIIDEGAPAGGSAITDSGTFSATETANVSQNITLSATDSGAFSATETASLQIVSTSSASDSGTFSTTETSSILVAANVAASDSGTFSATEASTSQSTFSRADSGTFSATDTSSSQSTLSRSDSGTFSATDVSGTIPATSTRTDTGTFSATETASLTILATKTANDSGTLSVTEISAVTPITPGVTAKVWNGTAFVTGNLKVWDGTQFVLPIRHTWTGSAFTTP